MKILIVGFGSIGRRHFRNLVSLGIRDVALFRSGKGNLPDEEVREYPIFYSIQEALRWCPDAVIVANPTALHLDVAIAAATAGCHILLEKPVSHSMDFVEEFRETVQKSGVRVLMGFQFRFHPGLRAIKRWIDQKAIGDIVSFHVAWGEYLPAWHPWEDYRQSYAARPELGGGVVHTLPHSFDYIRWLLGTVTNLWAFSGIRGGLDLKVIDSAVIGLRCSNGAYGTLHLDYIRRPANHYLEITGNQGTCTWDAATGIARRYLVESEEWEESVPENGFVRNTLFLDEMRHFLRVVEGVEDPICTLDDGIQALYLALATDRSSQTDSCINFNLSSPHLD